MPERFRLEPEGPNGITSSNQTRTIIEENCRNGTDWQEGTDDECREVGDTNDPDILLDKAECVTSQVLNDQIRNTVVGENDVCSLSSKILPDANETDTSA